MEEWIKTLTLYNLGLTFINLVLAGFTLKMFTEIVKDKLQDKRKKSDGD